MDGVDFQSSRTCSVRIQVNYILKPEAIPGTMSRATRSHSSVSLPLPLLKEIDKVVEIGLMGFRSRAEFVAEATRTYLRDLHRMVSEGKSAARKASP